MTNQTNRKRARKGAEKSAAAGLLDALKFISMAQKAGGSEIYHRHCVISNNRVSAYDGVLTISRPISEDLKACPNTEKLVAALKRCGETYTMSQLDEDRLTIRSGKFRATIPCVPMLSMPTVGPDAACAVVSDRLRDCIAEVMVLAKEGAPRVFEASVLIDQGCATASNGYVILQAWHGIDLPPGIVLPKVGAVALCKAESKLTGFGFSEGTVTFWFDDESFIKAQLFLEQWPDVNGILNAENLNPWPLPLGFYEAIHAVTPFSGNVHFDNNEVRSEPNEECEARFECEGVIDGQSYNGVHFLAVERHVDKCDFTTNARQCFFFNDDGTVRGAVAKMSR